ncbi:MAG: hypothetical protein K2V38_29865, partial [Gemmataceae bacterium]|nr:hypothetical protein [Gemmataceae bacterium]
IEQNSVVVSQAEFEERVTHVLATYGPPVLAERFVHGREFHVNVIETRGGGLVVLPLAEIAYEGLREGQWPVYTFAAKWHEQSDEYRSAPVRTPVYIDPGAFAELEAIARKAFRVLGCRDLARLDVRMGEQGEFHILEVNPNPYLNSITLVNGLLAVGRSYESFVVEMALMALARGRKAVPAGIITVPEGLIKP